MTGGAHAIASIMTMPNGSSQSMGTSSPIAPLRKSDFFMISDFADVIDERVVHQRANDSVVIVPIGPIDFCRDLKRDAGSYGDFDGAIDPFSDAIRPSTAR